VVLLFRFLLIMLLARFRREIGPFDTARLRFTVLPTDCDLNFHLNAGRFVSFMDVSRVELLARMRLFAKVMKKGWRPVNGGMLIRFRRSILPFERFDVRSRVVGWDEKWFYFEHILEREGNLCAVGHARGLFRGNGQTIEPRTFLELIGHQDTPSPELPEVVLLWREAEDARNREGEEPR
jgi:acyl-CoA thioesterase FadM